jgi:hypothetical protein
MSDASTGVTPNVRVSTSQPVRPGRPSFHRGTRGRAHADALGPCVPAETVR